MIAGLARRWLGLDAPRFRVERHTEWVALRDGVRLATHVTRPRGGGARRPSVLFRSAEPARGQTPGAWLAHWLGGRGYAVVVQECRGRHGSEGEFAPFEKEGEDGAEAMAWVAGQPWWDGRLALVGLRYAAHAAFAAAARAQRPPAALVAAFGARDPHAFLFEGGAMRLANALHFATAHSEPGPVSERRLDLARGVSHRPLVEADRVTLRQVDCYREWLEHPLPDDYWSARTPALPSPLPPTLLIAGWPDPALPAQLADYAALREAAARDGGAAPELLVGPWPAPSQLGSAGLSRAGALGVCARQVLRFLERHLGGAAGDDAEPVHVFVGGHGRWRPLPRWPAPDAGLQHLFLRSNGSANSLAGDGRLESEPPAADEPSDRFQYDPDDPAPSAARAPAGARAAAARADVLCYTTAPLPQRLDLLGPVRAVLHAASSAEDTDFSARLVLLGGDGAAQALCEGLLRCRWRAGGTEPQWLRPDEPTPLEITLGHVAWRVAPGQRLRLEVSSSSFPRYDRNGNVRADPARVTPEQSRPAQQTLFHDAARPSQLLLSVLREG